MTSERQNWASRQSICLLAGSKKAAESHRGGAYGRAGGSPALLSDDESDGGRPSGYGGLGRGGAAYGSSNSLRSQDRASDGGMGGAASTSGFSGFEDATEGKPIA